MTGSSRERAETAALFWVDFSRGVHEYAMALATGNRARATAAREQLWGHGLLWQSIEGHPLAAASVADLSAYVRAFADAAARRDRNAMKAGLGAMLAALAALSRLMAADRPGFAQARLDDLSATWAARTCAYIEALLAANFSGYQSALEKANEGRDALSSFFALGAPAGGRAEK